MSQRVPFHDLHVVDVVLQEQVVRADLVDDLGAVVCRSRRNRPRSKLVFPAHQARDAALTLGPVTGRQVMQHLNELMVVELLTESVGVKGVRE